MKKTVYLFTFLFCGFLIYFNYLKKSQKEQVQEKHSKLLKNHPFNIEKNLSTIASHFNPDPEYHHEKFCQPPRDQYPVVTSICLYASSLYVH